MAQGTGTTSPTFNPILTPNFLRLVKNTINKRRLMVACMRKKGNDLPTRSKSTVFGVEITRAPNHRFVGDDDPATYPETDGGIDVEDSIVTYMKAWGAHRIKAESMLEATKEGALADGKRLFLNSIVDSFGMELERCLVQQKGDGVLFQVKTTTAAATPQTIPIKNLGGFDGEKIGYILESLALKGLKVHFSDATGNAARDTTASKITGYDETLDAETITVASLPTQVEADDVVYLSRSDNSGVTPQYAYPTGLPGLIDDWTRRTTLQALTEALVPQWKSRILSAGGARRVLDRGMLRKMITTARVRQHGGPTDPQGHLRFGFVSDDSQRDRFAETLEASAQYTAPLLTEKGWKALAGVNFEEMQFSGVPWFTSPIHLRGEMELVDWLNLFLIHNGPWSGRFLEQSGQWIDDGPQKQYVYGGALNYGMYTRASSVGLHDLTTDTEI